MIKGCVNLLLVVLFILGAIGVAYLGCIALAATMIGILEIVFWFVMLCRWVKESPVPRLRVVASVAFWVLVMTYFIYTNVTMWEANDPFHQWFGAAICLCLGLLLIREFKLFLDSTWKKT
jgi:hypothetical protein